MQYIFGLVTILCLFGSHGNLTAAPSQRIFKSARLLSRGDAGLASVDGYSAMFYNPAGLAQGKGIYKETVLASPFVELSTATRDLVRKIIIEEKNDIDTMRQQIGKNQHLGFNNFTGIVFRRAALGALVSGESNVLVEKKAEDGGLETVTADSAVNQVLAFTLAEKFFGDSVFVGATGKYINRDQAALEVGVIDAQDVVQNLSEDDVVASGVGSSADLGGILRLGSKRNFVNLGVVIENVGDASLEPRQNEGQLAPLEQLIHVGMTLEIGTKISKLRSHFDFRDAAGDMETNPIKRVHLGTEVNFRDIIGVGLGLHQGYPSIGGYFDVHVFRIDAGMYSQELGEKAGQRADQRFFLRLVAGF